MSSASVLDTRTPYRGARTHMETTAPASQTGSAGLTIFQRHVHQLIRSSHPERAARREAVIDRLRASRDPMNYLNELLEQCVLGGGPEGLDIAIDVLSQFGGLVIEYSREFWRKDVKRWQMPVIQACHHMNDDIWYVLLRAAAASGLDVWQKLPILSYCAADGTVSVREASIRALGDVGGPGAARLIHRLGSTDASTMVREAAAEVLDDLEG